MSAPALAVSNLHKRYGEHVAVDGLAFSVAPGEVFGLLGPNGAGKTTTVECILGLKAADQGEISVLGLNPLTNAQQIKARLGVQLQSTGLFARLTVQETLDLYSALFPKVLPMPRLLELVGLTEKRKAGVGALSGGQRQRLALALALLNDPDLLFLDEPTAAMDPAARRTVWEIVRDLKRQGKTILLTTHLMDEAAQLCDRVAVVDHGRIMVEGPPAQLVRQHFQESAIEFEAPAGQPLGRFAQLTGVARAELDGNSAVLYTADVPGTVTALLEFARASGFGLSRFTVREATLEDLFLRLTGRKIRE